MKKDFPKNYKPAEVEEKIYKLWEKGNFFNPRKSDKKPFVIIMPPPNANASLHVGSAVFVTIEDIMVRYQRMKGNPVLWVPGVDHAGIATQVMYEKKLREQNKTRFDLGRESFFNKVYEFTMKNKKTIENQLKKLGASCDWSRKKFTLDESISKSVYFTFKKLYEDNLIYRGDRIINWCSRCGTTLSDLEVKYEPRKAKLWHIGYPLANHPEKKIIVATTRPETMLGDTAVAVNPKDKRYKELTGKEVVLPLLNRKIPIIADRRVDPEFGTGAVKITPAHDALDNKIGGDHKLETINIISKEGKMTENAGEYEGLTVKEARRKIVEDLKEEGSLEKEEDYEHSISLCERCDTPIESLISKQWFLKTKPMAKPAIEAVKKGDVKFISKKFEKIYYHWMENIDDWCISRQLWWGQRIPVWYCEECGEIIVEDKKPNSCPKCGSEKLHQDPDTLDTWFSSGQWPFTVFGWPEKTEDYNRFYPTTIMETGWDILFFWVARMIMLGIYCTGKPPFKYVYLHGLVRGKDGRKMSKSRNNAIDPLEIIDNYGADALRMALIFGSGKGKDIIISEEKIIGQRRFTNKIWNAARFINQIGDFEIEKDLKKLNLSKKDKWILKQLDKTTKEMEIAFEDFNFHIGAEKIYDFFWHKFCDITIEDTKKRIYNAENEEEKKTANSVLHHVFLESLKLLHPFMPFITEEIYQTMPRKDKKAMIAEEWPLTKISR